MFKYSAPSTQPVVAPEFHGIPEPAKAPGEKAPDRSGLSPVRTPSASAPRLRTVEADDDGDLRIPDVLRKPPDTFFGPPAETAPGLRMERRSGFVPVAAASAAGLVLALAGGLMFYAAGSATQEDAGTVPVRTVSIDGQPSADSPGTRGPDPAGPAGPRALDRTGFQMRFNSAKAADRNPGSLKVKSQDRIAQIPLERAGEAGDRAAQSRPGSRSDLPVLGYASAPNPHFDRDEGQRAIASAAGTASSKGGGIAVAAAPADNAAGAGQMKETATVTADVNLRSTAEKDAPVLTVVPNGSSVGVGSCGRWWCAVEFDGRSGFVGKKFVAGKG